MRALPRHHAVTARASFAPPLTPARGSTIARCSSRLAQPCHIANLVVQPSRLRHELAHGVDGVLNLGEAAAVHQLEPACRERARPTAAGTACGRRELRQPHLVGPKRARTALRPPSSAAGRAEGLCTDGAAGARPPPRSRSFMRAEGRARHSRSWLVVFLVGPAPVLNFTCDLAFDSNRRARCCRRTATAPGELQGPPPPSPGQPKVRP